MAISAAPASTHAVMKLTTRVSRIGRMASFELPDGVTFDFGKAGDRLIVEGLQKVRPGVKVAPEERTPQPASLAKESPGAQSAAEPRAAATR